MLVKDICSETQVKVEIFVEFIALEPYQALILTETF